MSQKNEYPTNKDNDQTLFKLGETELNAIGKNIKKLRKSKKQSQATLAEALGYKQPNSISKLESGNGITLDSLYAIANYYKVSLNYFITGEDSAFSVDSLSPYISFEYTQFYNSDIDTKTYKLPIIKINSALYNALIKITVANTTEALPEKLREQWIDEIKKEFVTTPLNEDFYSFIALSDDILNEDTCDSHRAIMKILEATKASSKPN